MQAHDRTEGPLGGHQVVRGWTGGEKEKGKKKKDLLPSCSDTHTPMRLDQQRLFFNVDG